MKNPALPFSQRLRDETRRAHSLAEKAGFVRGFLRGVVDVPTYARLLASYQLVYHAMEDALASHQTHPAIAWTRFPELHRGDAIARDLAHFTTAAGLAHLPPPPAAHDYVERIREVAARQPELLVAHAYTRYLGDLSGGQILKTILRRSLALPEGVGTAFYDFAAIADPAAFKTLFRFRLDTLPVSAIGRDAIIAEANHVFRLNTDLFNALGGNAWTALRHILVHSLRNLPRAA